MSEVATRSTKFGHCECPAGHSETRECPGWCYTPTVDLEGLLNQPDKDKLKRELPLTYVCSKLGIHLDDTGYAICPFHTDTNPSFYLWDGDDGNQRWWCQPCGFGGDLFDLIQRHRSISFPDAVEFARQIYKEIPPGTELPRHSSRVRRDIDPAQWYGTINKAREEAAAVPGAISALTGLAHWSDPRLCEEYDLLLRVSLGWGIQGPNVIMPHWDQDSNLLGAKMRGINGRRASLPGSRYTHLYGSWLPQLYRDTLLLEGETDMAFAMFHAAKERIDINVLALPSGAGMPPLPEWFEFLRGQRTIYLAFDPDPAGVEATRTWISGLDESDFHGVVKVCALPLGQDLRDAQPKLRHLLDNAKRPLPIPTELNYTDGGYLKYNQQGEPRSVTTWTLEPIAQLLGGDSGFDVILHTQDTKIPAQILLSDLANVGTLRRWAARHNEVFTGTDAEVQQISKRIKAEGAITPVIYQTHVVGMHHPPKEYNFAGPSVVYPHGHFGKVPWRYVHNGKAAANVTDQVLLPTAADDSEWDWSYLRAFHRLSEPKVTEPLLAWMCAAFRRHEVGEFPLLFIGGSSGVGKSTLARLALRMCGSDIEIDLGASTKFVLLTTLASTTSIPIFVDEWTALSNQEARLAFKGLIPIVHAGRDAGRGQADLSIVEYEMQGPVIVAGEDTFVLTREQERMVSISPTRAGQNVRAFRHIQNAPLELFAKQFAEWIIRSEGELPTMHRPFIDRVEHNKNCLLAGWETLLQFLHEESLANPAATIPDLPAVPDLSCFETAKKETVDNVYIQALFEGLNLASNGAKPYVWEQDDGVYFRPRALIGALSRSGINLDLPGGATAMVNFIKETYPSVYESNHFKYPELIGGEVRAHFIPNLTLTKEEQ